MTIRMRYVVIDEGYGLVAYMGRYSEFDDLRQRLLAAFQHAKNSLPPLPPKSVLCMSSNLLGSVLMLTNASSQVSPVVSRIPADWPRILPKVSLSQYLDLKASPVSNASAVAVFY